MIVAAAETHLTSEQMPNSRPIYRGVGEKAVKVEQESGTSPKLNPPDFTIAKPLIRTKLVPNQPVALIFDELLEIKSAKCC